MDGVCLFTPDPKGVRIVWEITHRCNYSCLHCCAAAGKPAPGELDTDGAKTVLDRLFATEVNSIYFSGGEPLARDDFFTIFDYAATKIDSSKMNIATNGKSITPEIAANLHERKVGCVLVSLDGHDNATAKEFRGPASAFSDAYNALKLLDEHNVNTRMGVIIWKKNRDHLEDYVKIGMETKAKNVFFNWLIPVGRAATHPEIAVDFQEYWDVARELEALKEQYADRIAVGYHRFKPITAEDSPCTAGTRILHVLPDGRVSPCSWLYKIDPTLTSERSLKEYDLAAIVNEGGCNTVRSLLQERAASEAGPGCIAMCKVINGSYSAKDPLWKND